MDKIVANIASGVKIGVDNVNTTNTISKIKEGVSAGVESVDLDADDYSTFISTTQQELGSNIDASVLADAFGTLSASIASDKYSASNGNFIPVENIATEYWTDAPLKFELQENGIYLILQLNNEGNYRPMGYTTAEGAVEYLKKIKSMMDISEEEKNDNDMNGDYINSAKISYITSNQLDDSVRKEIMEYAKAAILNKEDIYNNMSEKAKDIIDGNIKVLNPKDNIREILDMEMDIVIPKNVKVKIDGLTIDGLEGKVLKYDSDDQVYKIIDNVDNADEYKYSKLDLLSLEIIELAGKSNE